MNFKGETPLSLSEMGGILKVLMKFNIEGEAYCGHFIGLKSSRRCFDQGV